MQCLEKVLFRLLFCFGASSVDALVNRTIELTNYNYSKSVNDPYLTVLVVHLIFLDHVTARCRSVVHDHVEIGPRLKLPLPVADRRKRNDDEEWSTDAVAEHLLHEAYALYCFSETHLVREDTILPVNNLFIFSIIGS